MFCFSFLGRPDNVSKPIPSSQTSQIACEQALPRGGGGGGGRACDYVPGNWFCIEKVDAKCWLVKMTLVMTSLPLARVFRALFRFGLIGGNLTAQSKGSHRELEAEFKFQRRSCKLSFLFPPSRLSAPESLPSACKQRFTVCHFYKPGKYLWTIKSEKQEDGQTMGLLL